MLLLLAAWLHLTSPHFELFTDAGERAGRDALRRLELIREVFARPTPLPVRVILFGSARDWKEFQPSPNTTGFYQSAPERDWIAMLNTEQAYRIVFHEYVHLVLNHTSTRLPAWLEEGTAEFYSTLTLQPRGVRLGEPVASHLQLLARLPWHSAQQLASLHPSHAGADSALFYAQSWALVHMLNLAPGYRTAMPRFAQLLDDGVPPLLAFEQAFGKSFDTALDNLRVYVQQGRFAVADVLAPDVSAGITVAPAAAAAELVLTELLLQLGRHDAAARRIARLPPQPETFTAQALLALARGEQQAAATHFRRAIDAGATAALPYFEYAVLLRELGAPAAEVQRYLAEAIGRNPNLAEAQFLLATYAQKEGRHADAVEKLRQAVGILPRQSYFWHALAISSLELGDTAQARRAAFRAAENAISEHEREMARHALRLVGAAETAPKPLPLAPKQDVIVPDSWQRPKGDARVEGILEQIDCRGRSAVFQVRVQGKPLRFLVDNPGDVLLNTPSAITFEFGCGAQRPRKVGIEFKAVAGADGVITAIDFLD
jgi:tetratricopeptide (TPR) repeat protein